MRVLTPSSLEDACAMLAAKAVPPTPIAGGTDVMVHWPGNLAARELAYLDLSGVGELRGLRWTDSHLELGALATYWDVIRDARCGAEMPLLVAAARTVGAIQIQSRGTWAGNIVNASPAADGVPALMAMDASVVLVSGGQAGELEREEVRLDEFYLGYKKMRLRAGQLVETVRVPRREYAFTLFEKVGARRAQAITKVGVAVTKSDAGWRVVANSVAPVVKRCRAVEDLLESGAPVRSPLGFAGALAKDVSPIDDIRSTAAYRRAVLARVLYFGLRGRAGVV
jgi:CO/xanthine dehydrogenase FAD-binding subunit